MAGDYKSDKELADELDAQDRLRARGYKQETCGRCGGTGQTYPDVNCYECHGRGYVWEAPITK